nr:unnamed protein product [Spirometra erinaceieuropaei]
MTCRLATGHSPDAANITSVLAPPFETLEVQWMNPTEGNCTLLSSTAIALLDGVRAAECNGTTAASSETNCSLTGLRNFTVYEVVVEVCTGPAEVDGVRGGDCNYCTKTSSPRHRTSAGAPDAANITRVDATPFETLEVLWKNPSERNGTLLSSTAIALLDGVRAAECNGTTAASSETNCSLTRLRNFTVYEVVVEVCTGPAEVDGVRGGDCSYCTNTSSPGHRTSAGAPDAANITRVDATPFETLEVLWKNPSERNGTLLSSTAIALLDGVRAADCNGTTAASSEANCSLTRLRNFTVYEVVVEVCTGPAEVDGVRGGDCNYCTNTSSSGHRTSPGVFEPHQLDALGNEIPKSDKTVADPLTQMSIKVALSTLPIKDVGPVSIVTAYVELASGTASQSRSRIRRLSSNSTFLYGAYDNKTWAPWEVVILNDSQGVRRRLNDTFFTIGDSSSEQTCDHCYNGPLSSGTAYRIGLVVYTETGAGMTKLHEMSTSRKMPFVSVF